jgi:hypothetical protein
VAGLMEDEEELQEEQGNFSSYQARKQDLRPCYPQDFL